MPDPIAQVDIEHDAKGLVEIAVILQGVRRFERHGVETVLPEQPAHALQHGGIVIDDKNGFAVQQGFSAFSSFQKIDRGRSQ